MEYPNAQAFWLKRGDDYELIDHVKTLNDFANYLIKDQMAQNQLRFITSEKKRYIDMWTAYYNHHSIETPKDIPSKIATSIMNDYEILHRKPFVHPNMPRRPLNSRYTQRVHYRLVKTIQAIIKA